MRIEVFVSKHDYKAVVEKNHYFSSIKYGFHLSFSNIQSDAYGYDFIKLGTAQPTASYYSYFCLKTGEYLIVSSGHLMTWYKAKFLNSIVNNQRIEFFTMKYTTDGDNWIDYLNGQAIFLVVGDNADYFFVGTIVAISLKFIFQSSYSFCCFQLEVYTAEA